jgi:hypothetical protein
MCRAAARSHHHRTTRCKLKKLLIPLLFLAALAGPAAAAQPIETTNVLSRPAPASTPGLWVPKYLTVQQQNDAFQRDYEARFAVYHTP